MIHARRSCAPLSKASQGDALSQAVVALLRRDHKLTIWSIGLLVATHTVPLFTQLRCPIVHHLKEHMYYNECAKERIFSTGYNTAVGIDRQP